MGIRKFAYENLSLHNIKGEKWLPIPGYEDLYEISSFGRVKTLERTYVNNIGASVTIRERIMKIRAAKTKSKTRPHDTYALMAGLCQDGKRKGIYVGRLVYHVFVERFDLADRSILISYKDWDGRNIRPENLYLTSISGVMQKSFKEQRYTARLTDDSKIVSQFDVQGKYIATYESMIHAAKETGFNSAGISRAANGTTHLHKGYVWQFGKSRKLKEIKIGLKRDGKVNRLLLQQVGVSGGKAAHLAVANLSLKTMEGEKWKDIRGYEGIYKISSYGRVKALNRVSGIDIKYLRPEFIKRLDVKVSKEGKEASKPTVHVTLFREGSKIGFGVARLVYSTFVEQFDLKNRAIKIGFTDGNPLNTHYKNLFVK